MMKDTYNFDMRLYCRESGMYYIEFERGKARSLRTRDITEARRLYKEIQREAIRGKLLVLDKHPTLTVGDYLSEYESWLERNRSYNTWERVHRIIPKFNTIVGASTLLSRIRRKDLDIYVDYCRGLGNKPSTINTEIRHIKAAFSMAVAWEYLKENPFQKFPQLRDHAKPRPILDIEDIEAVFGTIGDNKRYRLIFGLYVYTGMRREEIYNLQWRDIRDGQIHVTKSKSYKSRTIPASKSLDSILIRSSWSVGRIVDVGLEQVAKGTKYYLCKAGFSHIRPHDLRHTFASHLLMAGVHPGTVAAYLGHSTPHLIYTTYGHILDRHLISEMEKLPY